MIDSLFVVYLFRVGGERARGEALDGWGWVYPPVAELKEYSTSCVTTQVDLDALSPGDRGWSTSPELENGVVCRTCSPKK